MSTVGHIRLRFFAGGSLDWKGGETSMFSGEGSPGRRLRHLLNPRLYFLNLEV